MELAVEILNRILPAYLTFRDGIEVLLGFRGELVVHDELVMLGEEISHYSANVGREKFVFICAVGFCGSGCGQAGGVECEDLVIALIAF